LPAPTISKGATLTRLAERQQSDGSAALAPRLSNAANIASMLRASRRTSDSFQIDASSGIMKFQVRPRW
jgi:hypothetical protein